MENRSTEETPLTSDHENRNKNSRGVSVLHAGLLVASLCLFGLAYLSSKSAPGVVNTVTLLSSDSHKTEKEIMLFGDSLIGVPASQFDMGIKLESDLEEAEPDYDTVISVSFGNGNTVFELYDRVEDDVLDRNDYDEPPDAVVMLYDTDAADEPDGGKDSYKSSYKHKLSSLLSKLKAKVSYVALAGPILKGEYKENDIDPKLDDYEKMNKEIAASHGVDYIPLRDMFQKQDRQDGIDQKAGHLTQDGQHPTQKGAKIIEKAFKDQILSWEGLYSGPTSTKDESKFKLSKSMEKLVESLKASSSYTACVESTGKAGCEGQARVMEAAEQQFANIMGGNAPDLNEKLDVIINQI